MKHDRPAFKELIKHTGFVWVSATLTVAILASLAALTFVFTSATSGWLLTVQGVASGACLVAMGLLLRFRSPLSATARKAEAANDSLSPVDDGLQNRRWVGVVEELVILLDELERHQSSFEPAAKEMIEHVDLRVQEILERSGVTVIAAEAFFDRARHQPESGSSLPPAGCAILETLRAGLAIDRRVFRRAIVRLETTPAEKRSTTST